MTYIHEYEVQNDTVKVEYCFSSVTDSIKVVDMWVNGKFHRVNWMSHEGRDKLMERLENDMTNRMCAVPDDAIIEPFMQDLMAAEEADWLCATAELSLGGLGWVTLRTQ